MTCAPQKSASLLSLLLLATSLLLTACPPLGVVCKAGTDRCGEGCADYQADERNCGGCGLACGGNQVCTTGKCECRAGSDLCAGFCVVTANDPKHCGQCGVACTTGQVCEAGSCKVSCGVTGNVNCAGACVALTTDPAHCGACNVACSNGMACRGGQCTWDLVAACFSSGQLSPIQAATEVRGPLSDVGSGPAALALLGRTVVVADGVDKALLQARPLGASFVDTGARNVTGSVPNQVLVASPYVYVINAQTGSLQVLKEGLNDDAGVAGDGGLLLGTVAELPLGDNTWPEGLARTGDSLWVPLYGGYGALAADAGQAVQRIDISNPEAPVLAEVVDLRDVDLKPFDGGAPVARPWAVTTHRGAVYVALNNLNPDTYAPEGPGLLVRIDATTRAKTVIELGESRCLNPQWLASAGTRLVVSCGGEVVYTPTFSVDSINRAGLVLVDETDTAVGGWAPTCPADAGLSDGGTSCPPVMPGRFAVRDGRVYLGDQNAGRLLILDIVDAGFVERRGPMGTVGAAVQACEVDAVTGVANVSDVLPLP